MKFCLELLDLKRNRILSMLWFYLIIHLAYASKSIMMEISRRKLKEASHITSQSRVENGRLMCAAGAPLTFTLLNSSVQKPFLREWCHPQSCLLCVFSTMTSIIKTMLTDMLIGQSTLGQSFTENYLLGNSRLCQVDR